MWNTYLMEKNIFRNLAQSYYLFLLLFHQITLKVCDDAWGVAAVQPSSKKYHKVAIELLTSSKQVCVGECIKASRRAGKSEHVHVSM